MFTSEQIAEAFKNGQQAIVSATVIEDAPQVTGTVRVIAIDGDTLYYTSDGVWYSTFTRGRFGDWKLNVKASDLVEGDVILVDDAFKSGGYATVIEASTNHAGTSVSVLLHNGFRSAYPADEYVELAW